MNRDVMHEYVEVLANWFDEEGVEPKYAVIIMADLMGAIVAESATSKKSMNEGVRRVSKVFQSAANLFYHRRHH